jgi:hypothetical protein
LEAEKMWRGKKMTERQVCLVAEKKILIALVYKKNKRRVRNYYLLKKLEEQQQLQHCRIIKENK